MEVEGAPCQGYTSFAALEVGVHRACRKQCRDDGWQMPEATKIFIARVCVVVEW